MNDLAPPQRLGRRMDHLLVDRGLFAWTHRVLGILSGCICVLSAIATNRLPIHRSVTGWYPRGGGVSALVFLIAALPFVVSYSSNIDLVSEKIARTALFAVCLVGSSLFVDACTILILKGDYSALVLGAVYCGQAVAYVGLGHLTLGRDPDSDIVGW
jgi:hypothetical protein